MNEILSKLCITDRETTVKNILRQYTENKYCIVHFLYFATIILNKLEQEDITSEKKRLFIEALNAGDFLLPDGIALRLLYRKYFGQDLPNLNGTDFLPFFFSNLDHQQKTEVIVYGGTESVSQEAANYIQNSFPIPVISTQHGFQEFDWSVLREKADNTIRIMLVGRGSPLQELWTEKNRDHICEHECLVFTVGGLLDFFAGTEKRAPVWMRTMKIEWLYRALSNPQKNLHKTLVSLQLLKFLMKK